jgi:hypothetical protein
MHRALPFLFIAVVAACSTTPNYDNRFGAAVREARLAQTLNPNPVTTDPVTGIDTTAALEAQKRYHESFKAPPPVVNVINIGGMNTSQNGGNK